MLWLYRLPVVLAVCGPAAPAHSAMVPRETEIDQRAMLPDPRDNPAPVVSRDSVVITNFGDATLALSYWDAEKHWVRVAIAPLRDATITCAKCATEIEISFHDGTQDQIQKIDKGLAYALYWASDRGRWGLAPHERVRRMLRLYSG